MKTYLPQKYQQAAVAIIPYTPTPTQEEQIMLISIDPTLPCFLCNQPATMALSLPPKEGSGAAWLMFPICVSCEERQVRHD